MIHTTTKQARPAPPIAGADTTVVGVYARSPQPRDNVAPSQKTRVRRQQLLQALVSTAAAAGALALHVARAGVAG